MARLLTPCFDLQGFDGTAGITGLASSATFETTIVRTGRASLKCVDGGAGASTHLNQVTATGNALFVRGHLYIGVAPTGAGDVIQVATGAASVLGSARLSASSTLQLFNSAGTQVGSDSAALSTGQWYRVEIKVLVPAAGNGTLELLLDGATVATSAAQSIGTTAVGQVYFGVGLNPTGTGATVYWDDCAVNDSTGANQASYPGSGKVGLLRPVSDSSRTGWVSGSSGTTNLWIAVSSTPPVGASPSTGTSQITDKASNTTDNYVTNLGAYTDALASGGANMGASDTVTLVQSVMSVAQNSTTATSYGQTLTNPTITESTSTGPSVSIGAAWPTGWSPLSGTVSYAPTPTLATKPTLKIRKNTSSGTITQQCCFMGLVVEYVSAATPLAPALRPRHRNARYRPPQRGRF